jgi:hypothetical protein
MLTRLVRRLSAPRHQESSIFLLLALLSAAPNAFAQDAPSDKPAGDAPADAPTDKPAAEAPAEAPADKPAAEAPAATEPGAAPEAPAEATPPAEAAPPKPPPYSLPFSLRPAGAGNVVRVDTAFAFYKDPKSGKSGSAIVPVLTGAYKVTPNFAPIVRLGFATNSPPDLPAPAPSSGSLFLNPLVGAVYGFQPAKELKLAFFLGFTIPIGGGGGDHPSTNTTAARNLGMAARSYMDNALFAVNDFAVIPGVDFAWVSGGFTAQVEATLFQLTRVKGSNAQKDSSRTNFTAGIHLGYFFIPELSLGAELRHQRWLSTPANVKADEAPGGTNSVRDNTTIAIGPRVHLELAKGVWFRPGIAYAFPIDDPLKKASEKIVQLDLPLSF